MSKLVIGLGAAGAAVVAWLLYRQRVVVTGGGGPIECGAGMVRVQDNTRTPPVWRCIPAGDVAGHDEYTIEPRGGVGASNAGTVIRGDDPPPPGYEWSDDPPPRHLVRSSTIGPGVRVLAATLLALPEALLGPSRAPSRAPPAPASTTVAATAIPSRSRR